MGVKPVGELEVVAFSAWGSVDGSFELLLHFFEEAFLFLELELERLDLLL